jgi:hypothetical protein
MTTEQRNAYVRLLDLHRQQPDSTITIIGRLHVVRGRPVLSVRSFTEVGNC